MAEAAPTPNNPTTGNVGGSTTAPPASTRRIALKKVFGTSDPQESLPGWCKSHNFYVHPSAELGVAIPHMGLGVVCRTQPILKGSTVIGCPRALAIEPSRVDDPLAPSAKVIHGLPRGEGGVSDFERVVLRLFAEITRRAKSPWAPWITAWPLVIDGGLQRGLVTTTVTAHHDDDDTTPSSSSGVAAASTKKPPSHHHKRRNEVVAFHESIATLEHTEIGQCLVEQNIHAMWLRLRPHIDAHTDTVFLTPLSESFEVFTECVLQIRSRNFHIEHQKCEGPFLLPCIDLINHAANPVIEEEGAEGENARATKNVSSNDTNTAAAKGDGETPPCTAPLTANVRFELHKKTFDVIALRDIHPGEQILYDYGIIPRARFLTEFQFLPSLPSLEERLKLAEQEVCRAVKSFDVSDTAEFEVDRAEALASMLYSSPYNGGDCIRFSPHQLVHVCAAGVVVVVGTTPCPTLDEAEERVKILLREGILFDEGLLVLQHAQCMLPLPTTTRRHCGEEAQEEDESTTSLSKEKKAAATNASQDDAEVVMSKRYQNIGRELINVATLLSLPTEEFNALRPSICRSWDAGPKLVLQRGLHALRSLLRWRLEQCEKALISVAPSPTNNSSPSPSKLNGNMKVLIKDALLSERCKLQWGLGQLFP